MGPLLDQGKRNILGVLVDVVDYEAAVRRILMAAREGRGLGATALAVHGVMTGVGDTFCRYRLNHLDLVTPDGQGVRWGLNLLYGLGLNDRVYGPRLSLEICAAAAAAELPIYLYGSRPAVLSRMISNLQERFPTLLIAGATPSAFRRTTQQEKADIAKRIRGSDARITFVGLGCPRQEVFVYEYRESLGMPVVAVGAAFDYLAGVLSEPPPVIQQIGLQWLYRLAQEPRRLWKRYALLNPAFASLLFLQATGLWRPNPNDTEEPPFELLYG